MYCRILWVIGFVVLGATSTWAGEIASDPSGGLMVNAVGEALQSVNYHPDYYYAFDINNDNADNLDWYGNPAFGQVLNGWEYDLTFRSNGPIDLVINVANTGATSEFEMGVRVTNETNMIWDGFRLELGFGTGASFAVSPTPDNLDFDTPDCDIAPSTLGSNWRAAIAKPWLDDSVTLMSDGTGDNLASGWATVIYYLVDIPDGVTQFTLRHTPVSAPEPSSLAALSMLVGGMFLRRRSRHV